jgi:hypothetical protein
MDDRDLFIHTQHGQFEYDPDFDIYRKVNDQPLTHTAQFGWLYVCVVLAAICYCIEFVRSW